MIPEKYKTGNKYIYKYLPINIFTLQTLINNELCFSAPNVFNDSIDSKFKLNVDPNIDVEGATNFYNSLNLSEKEKEEKIKNFQQNKDNFKSDIEIDFNTRLRQTFGICCFSEKNNENLMWAHYADKHKGICLKFDWQIHANFFMGYKVQYEKELPQISYYGNGIMETAEIVLTKLDSWSYEKEVRAIIKLENGNNQLASFNPKALKGIIFGEKIQEIDKKTILNIVKRDRDLNNVELFNQSVDSFGQIKIEKQ